MAGELPDETRVVYVSPLKALSNDIEKNLREPLAGIADEAGKMGLLAPAIRVAVRTGDRTVFEITVPSVRIAFVPSYNNNANLSNRQITDPRAKAVSPYGIWWADWATTSSQWIKGGAHTGNAASGPMLPSPSTAEPSVTTATVLPTQV